MQEVVEQIHRDQRQQEQEEQRGQQQGSQSVPQQANQASQLNPEQPSSSAQHSTQRGSTASKDKPTTENREEARERDSGKPPPGKMQARSKGWPSNGQPRSSAQTQQQRQRKATGARQPEARPAQPEE
jgi:hypothetical protein